MSINSSFFMSDHNFDVTVKSLLLGYSRKETAKVSGCVNVVVFGTTEASATAYVSNLLKGAITENIRCAGVDTKSCEMRGKGFSGYIVMLPEMRYIGAEHFDKITETVEVLTIANCGKNGIGEYKDLEILFANRDIEASFFGSLFEKWKTERENTDDWHIYGEHVQFSRTRLDRPSKSHSVYLGEDDIEEAVDPDAKPIKNSVKGLRFAPPIVLSWTKVAEKLLAEGRELATVTTQVLHPVRFGPQFKALSPYELHRAIIKFSRAPMQNGNSGRTVCVHDSLARMLFEDQVRPCLAIGRQYATECGVADPAIEYVVTLEELEA
jgi:hypothetical protein